MKASQIVKLLSLVGLVWVAQKQSFGEEIPRGAATAKQVFTSTAPARESELRDGLQPPGEGLSASRVVALPSDDEELHSTARSGGTPALQSRQEPLPSVNGWSTQVSVSVDQFDQRAPNIACDNNNNLYLAFEDTTAGFSYTRINIRKSTDFGRSWFDWSGAVNTAQSLLHPSLTYANGQLFATYQRESEMTFGVGRWDLASGSPSYYTLPTPIVIPPNVGAIRSRICSNSPAYPTGGASVFVAYLFTPSVGPYILYFTRSTDNGVTWSTQSQIGAVPRGPFPADVGMDWGTSGLFISYVGTAADSNKIKMRKSVDNGATFGSALVIDPALSPYDRYNKLGPSVAVFGNNVLVGFQESYGGSDDNVIGLYSLNGGSSWTRNYISSEPTLNEQDPWVSRDNAGNFYITFTRRTGVGTGTVYAAVGNGTPIIDLNSRTAISSTYSASPWDFTAIAGITSTSGSSGAMAAWVAGSPGDFNIYGNSFLGDATPPSAPIGMSATPSGWTNVNSFSINWTNPSDPSGIAAAWCKVGSVPTSSSDGTRTTNKPFTTGVTAQGGQTIYVWLEDGATNKDQNNRSSTVLYYDGTVPTSGTISINNGSSTTTSLVVTLTLSAADGGGSGLSGMRFSNDNGSWSSWETYATTKSGWDLSQYGGTTNAGQKWTYVQYRDGAGNVSASYSDDITYNSVPNVAPSAPIGLGATPSGWTNVNSFSIDWTNPSHSSAIVAAWCKVGSVPTSSSDGTRTTNKPFVAGVTTQGGQTIYVWLEDGSGNKDQNNRSSVVLYYDGTVPSSGTISINSGSSTTSSLVVTLSLSAADGGGSGLSGMRFSNDNASWSSWETYATSRTGWDLSQYGGTTNGGQKWAYVQYRDGAGNVSASYSDDITYNSVPNVAPSAPIGLGATPSGWTNVNSFSIDWTNPSHSSAIVAAWCKVGSVPTSSSDGTRTTNKPFMAGVTTQGGQTIYVWLEDGSGNKDQNNRSSTVLYYDGTVPTSGTISINGGSSSTTSLVVTLSLSATDGGGSGLSEMRFSNDNGTWSSWESYAVTKTGWDLSQNGGTTNTGQKWTYVQYRDGAGNVSASYADDIAYTPVDVIPPPAPIGLAVTPSGWTNVNSFSINWTNPSDASGIAAAWYRLGSEPTAKDDGTRTTSKPFITGVSTQGGETIYVWLEDGAGNKDQNNRSSTTLYHDGTNPSGTLSINSGSSTTTSAIVTLNLSADDGGGSGLSEMRFSNDNATWSSWEAYTTTKTGWDLSQYGGTTNAGQKWAYVQYRDGATNVSVSYADDITYVQTPQQVALVSPGDGAIGEPITLVLNWNPSVGATKYHLQLSTSPSFIQFVVDDATLDGLTRQVDGLAHATTYYWKVRGENGTALGPYSVTRSFKTQETTSTTTFAAFPSAPTASTSYRLFSVPGTSAITPADIVTGRQVYDWRFYRDNGNPSDFLVEFFSGSSLTTGEGYWLLKKGDLHWTRNVTMPALDADGTYTIPLHSGWNIIGNPFIRTVAWSAVQSANGITGEVLTGYEGAYVNSSVLEPFKGYYIRNSANKGSLKIPYPFSGTPMQTERTAAISWEVQVVFTGDINQDAENFFGIAPSSKQGLDERDHWKPPLFMDQGFVYFPHVEWDSLYSRFSSDYRPDVGNGQVWDMEISNPRKTTGRIVLRGVESIPPEFEVTVVNVQDSEPVNAREQKVLPLRTGTERVQLKALVGTKSFIERELAKLIPSSIVLAQNYPNPFNPVTSIQFALPNDAMVQLEVISVLGQRVNLLIDGPQKGALHTVPWDATDMHGRSVASGVYFYRLIVNGTTAQTRKMILVR